MSDTGRVTPKAAALTSIQDAIDELGRAGGPRLPILNFLLTDARAKVGAVEELVWPRRAKKDKTTT